MSAVLILLVLAIICWAIAAIQPWPVAAPFGIGWLGLMFYGLSLIVGK